MNVCKGISVSVWPNMGIGRKGLSAPIASLVLALPFRLQIGWRRDRISWEVRCNGPGLATTTHKFMLTVMTLLLLRTSMAKADA